MAQINNPGDEKLKKFEQSGTVPGKDHIMKKKAIALAAMGAFLDGYDLLVLGVALLQLIPQWGLSFLDTGILTATAFAGMIIGSAVFGVVADKMGRKEVFLTAIVTFIVGSLGCGLSQNLIQLISFRFLIGLAIGMDAPTSTSIIVEFSTDKNRGRNGTLMQIFWPLGSVVAAIIAISLYLYAGVHAWRWMLASGVIPAIIVLYLRKDVPKSPYWLEVSGPKTDEEPVSLQQHDEADSPRRGSIKELFHQPWAKSVIFVISFWFLTNLTSGLFVYMPVIAKQSFEFGDIGAMLFGAGVTSIQVIVLAVLAYWSIDRHGRRPMSIVGSVLMTLFAFILAFLYGHWLLMAIVFSLMLISIMSPCQGPFWVWSVEILPTRLRATGQGVATSIGKIGSLTATLLFPVYLDNFGWQATMLTYSAIFLIVLVLVIFLAPETKDVSLAALDQADQERQKASLKKATEKV